MENKLHGLADAPALEGKLNLQVLSGTNTFTADEILHKYYTYVSDAIRNTGQDNNTGKNDNIPNGAKDSVDSKLIIDVLAAPH